MDVCMALLCAVAHSVCARAIGTTGTKRCVQDSAGSSGKEDSVRDEGRWGKHSIGPSLSYPYEKRVASHGQVGGGHRRCIERGKHLCLSVRFLHDRQSRWPSTFVCPSISGTTDKV